MTIRSPQENQQHSELIRTLVDSLAARGYENICASHLDEFEDNRPEAILAAEHNHTFSPDIFAEKEGQPVLFEVETAGSLDAPSTQVELVTFARHAAEHDMLFYLVVPDTLRIRAEAALQLIPDRRQRATFVLSMPVR